MLYLDYINLSPSETDEIISNLIAPIIDGDVIRGKVSTNSPEAIFVMNPITGGSTCVTPVESPRASNDPY